MKPIYAIENGRWSSVYHSEKYQDVHNVGFTVKFADSEKLHSLIIKTDEDNSIALTYSLDHGQETVCDEQSWLNALLQASNQDGYSAHRPKEFELRTEGNEYCYALTQDSKKAIWKDHSDAMKLFRNSFTAGSAFVLPNTNPGPKFPNDDSELQSTATPY